MFTRGTYANVAATAALVISLGGTSYAAVMITGQQIKDGTVTTKDVKNKTLLLKDFSGTAKAGLKGATGARGATGPMGPAAAFSTYNDTGTAMVGTYKTVLSLSLPAGNFVVVAKARESRTVTGSDQFALCRLSAPDGAQDFSGADTPDYAGAWATLTNTVVTTLAAPGVVNLDCAGTSGSTIYWKKLTAIQTGSLTNTAGADVAKVGTSLQGNTR